MWDAVEASVERKIEPQRSRDRAARIYPSWTDRTVGVGEVEFSETEGASTKLSDGEVRSIPALTPS